MMEVERRKHENLVGVEMVLGNGETWTVPSLPLNSEGERIAKMIDEMAQQDEDTDANQHTVMQMYFKFMYALLKLNYPALTEDEARDAGLFQMGMFSDFAEAMMGQAKKV
jgi:hypothetical protein